MLLSLDSLNKWPDVVKEAQRGWIGRSEGARVHFNCKALGNIEIFTTRIDTIHGVSFLAIGHENHAMIEKLKLASPDFT